MKDTVTIVLDKGTANLAIIVVLILIMAALALAYELGRSSPPSSNRRRR